MEGERGTGVAADGSAPSDSFSQLWTDVMGMLVSFGGGVARPRIRTESIPNERLVLLVGGADRVAGESVQVARLGRARYWDQSNSAAPVT